MSLEIDKIKRFNCILWYNFYLNYNEWVDLGEWVLDCPCIPFMCPMYSVLPLPMAHQKILNLTLNLWESINSHSPIVSLCSVICYVSNPWHSFCLIRHSWSTKRCKWNPKNDKRQHKLYKGISHILMWVLYQLAHFMSYACSWKVTSALSIINLLLY